MNSSWSTTAPESILLIAAGNGLGHARRLLNIGISWSEEVHVKIALTDKQRGLLQNELQELQPIVRRLQFISIPIVGLQGPENEISSRSYKFIPSEVLEELFSAEMVFSDNALWPWHYRGDSVFLGHFTWADYYSVQLAKGRAISKLYLNFLDTEKALQELVEKAIILEDFVLGDIGKSRLTFPVKLPRYIESNHEAHIENRIAHVAVGRTGIEKVSLDQLSLKFPNWTIKTQETHLLGKAGYLPEMIIGRPGIGTLRDCIQRNLKFYPIGSDDPELENNVNVVLRNSKLDENTGIIQDINPQLLARFPTYSRIKAHFA